MMLFDHKTPWCQFAIALLVWGAFISRVEGAETDDVVCGAPLGVSDGTLPDDSFQATSSLEGLGPADARSSKDGWCPSADDDDPCLTVNLTVLTAVSKIQFYHPEGRDDFAETWDLLTLSPGRESFRTIYTGLKALEEGNRYYLPITPPMVVTAFKICPRTSGEGLPCIRFNGTGCDNEDLCPAAACPGSTKCVGVNYCMCALGQFGSQCQWTAETVMHTTLQLEEASVETNKSVTNGADTLLTGTGFDAENSSLSIVNGFMSHALHLKGANASVSMTAPICLGNLRTCTGFTLSMGMSVSFESETATFPILATNGLDVLQGVSVTVEEGDLIVKVLAGQYGWNTTVKNILGEDVCALPKMPGVCAGKWYYNSDKSRCEHFRWGMCGGNNNTFGSKKDCEAACVDSSEAECTEEVQAVSCPKPEEKYFYNKNSKKCQKFHSHACRGNANNFDDEVSCEEKCANTRKVTLLSGRWYKFAISWSSYGGIRVLINNKLVNTHFQATVLDPLTDPATPPATSELTFGYSSLITANYQTDLTFEDFNFWPVEYSTVTTLVDSFGDCAQCYGPGSLGCYDDEVCTCKEGFLGQFCNQTADSRLIGFVSFESIASGYLYSSLGMLSMIQGDPEDHNQTVFTFTNKTARLLPFDFDIGCIGDLSCRDGFTFSSKALFEATSTVVIFSIKTIESQSEVSLYYTGGKLVVYLEMEDTQYFLEYEYTPATTSAVFAVSYSEVFGLSLIVDDVVVATVTEVVVTATVETFLTSFESETLSSLTISSFGYAGFHYSQLALADISISDVCREDFCENGGVCKGLSGCECAADSGYKGARCNIKDDQDIMFNTVEGSTLLQKEFLGFSVMARGTYREVAKSVILDSREESSFLQIESLNRCLHNPEHCYDGITMAIDFAVRKWEDDTVIVLMSTGGDEEYAGFYLAYDVEMEQFICVYQTYRQRWTLKVDYKLSINSRLNVGFSWDWHGLSLFVDNVFIGKSIQYKTLEFGEVKRSAGSLRLGSCYTGMSTQNWEMRMYSYSAYSASLTLLGELSILSVESEEKEEGRPCDSNPCVNGQCQNKHDKTFSCRCFFGFKGDNCDAPVSAFRAYRFSFLSVVRHKEYLSIKTSTFPLRGYGNVTLFKKDNSKYIRCSGGRSNVQLNFRRLRKITSLFMAKTVSATSSFSFNINFRLVAKATATSRLILFSMGELEAGALKTTGMLVYYLDGNIYCTLSLPDRKYELSFEYRLQSLSQMKSFVFSFNMASGFVVSYGKGTTKVTTYRIQSYETSEIFEAFIGSRDEGGKDYDLEISNCAFSDETPSDLEANGVTLGLCPTDFCKNDGECNGLDQCLCNATTSFTGPDCSLTESSIMKEYNYFSTSTKGTITASGGLSGTTNGNVTVATETTITASKTGSYIELDTSKSTCLSDLSSCTAGLTLCLDLTFTSLEDNSHLCLLSTGGQTSYGMSLTFDNDEQVLSANVKRPYRTWNIDASFSPEINKNYNVCLSWSMQGGVAISVNNKIKAHQREFVFSNVFMPDWPLSKPLRFGHCYGVVHTESWSYSMKSYQYYNASLLYLSQASVLPVEVPEPPAPVVEKCEVETFKTTLTSIVSTGLELFTLAADSRDTKCSLLSQEITKAKTSVSGCWKEDDRSVSSSSPLSFIRYTQRSNLQAFTAIHTLLCTQATAVSDSTCDLVTIATKVEAFFAATNADSFSIGACSSVRDIYLEFKTELDKCAESTMDLMSTLQVQMQTTVRSVCAKSTCNIGYAGTCINESVSLIASIASDDGYTEGVCKQIKQSMACFSNHTVDCGEGTYRSLSKRVEEIHKTYQQQCFLKPPAPVDPDDCEAKTADQLDRVYSLLASIDSNFFTQAEICELTESNTHLLLEVPKGMADDRLEEFRRAQQILLSHTLRCKIIPETITTCKCDHEKARGCLSDAKKLFEEITVDCSAVETSMNCMRENTHGCDNTSAVDALFNDVGSYLLGAPECVKPDPGPQHCLVCDPEALTSCGTDVCTLDAQCLMNRTKNCGSLVRLRISIAYQLSFESNSCTGDSVKTAIQGKDYPFAGVESCVNGITGLGVDSSMEDVCAAYETFGDCIKPLSLEKPYNMILSYFKNYTRHIKSFCDTPRPDTSGCKPSRSCLSEVAFLSFNGIEFSVNCGEVFEERIRTCYPESCTDENITKFYDHARDWGLSMQRNSCNIASQEEIAGGCNLMAATTCVKDLTTKIFTGKQSCGAVAAAKDCVLVNMRQCPDHLKKTTDMLMKKLGKLTAKECCLAKASTCDPAAAVMCVIDVTHLARMPSPDWEGICGKVESSIDCMRSFTDTCEDCQKETVHYIAQRLNEDIVRTCRNPPETRCKVTKALKCVDHLKEYAALTDSDEVYDDITCLRVYEAQTCIKQHVEECDETVRFTVDYQLTKVIQFLEAEDCKVTDRTENCADIFRERVEDILKYNPRSPNNPRCRLPGMKGPVYTDLEECEPDLKCDSGLVPRHKATLPRLRKDGKSEEKDKKIDEEKDSKKDSKDKDSDNKASEKKNSKDKDSDKKGSEKKDSKAKDSDKKGSEKKNSKDTDSDKKGSEKKNSKDKDSDKKGSEKKNSKDKDSDKKGSEKKNSKEAKGKNEGTMEWSFDWSSTDSHWVCVPECEDGSQLEYMPSDAEDEYEWQCVSPDDDSSGKISGSEDKDSKDKDSKDKDSKDKDSKDKDSKDKDSKDKDSKVKDSKDKDSKVKDSKVKDSKDKDSKDKDSKDKDSKVKDSKDKDSKDKDSKDKDSKDKDSKDKDSKVKDSKDKDSKVKDSKDKDSKDKDSKKKDSKDKDSKDSKKSSKDSSHKKDSKQESKGPVYKNQLDHLCTEARAAWTCVENDLKAKHDSKSAVLMKTLSGLWALAIQKCDAGEEEFYCYSCDGELDNDQCNMNRTVCSDKQSVCYTRVHRDDDNEVLSLRKGCAAAKECVAGCADGVCNYCCPDGGCNRPLEGPVSPVCSVSYAAKCALTLTQTLTSSSHLDCSAFELELSCMREVREKCVTENHYQLMNLTESLYQSVEFKKCLLKLAPPTCSLHSVVSLGMILTGSFLSQQDVCHNYDATYEAVLHAKETDGCSSSLLRQVDSSLRLARSQLIGYGCPSIDPIKDHCKPELQSCDIDKAQHCVMGIDKLLERSSFTEHSDTCRRFVNMSSCLMRYSHGCSVTKDITMKAIKKRFDMISSGLRDRCEDEVKASSCEEDKERRCEPMKAVTSCFESFSIASVFGECQNLKLVRTCIMRYTRGCLPIQRKVAGTLLYLQPNMADIMNRCPKEEEDEEETPYTQVMSCLGKFSVSLKAALSSPCNSMERVCTTSINVVRKCLMGLDLGMQAKLSPLERYYISDAVNVIKDLKETFCESPEPEEEVAVSTTCKKGYESAARCISVQTIGVITRPFLPVNQIDSFCSHFSEVESCVEKSLSVCTTTEKTSSISTYLETLRRKTYTTCMERQIIPSVCNPKVAESVLMSLTAFMEYGNISASQQCMAVNTSLQLVTKLTHLCPDSDLIEINIGLKSVAAKFSDVCPSLVKELACKEQYPMDCETSDENLSACVAPIAAVKVDISNFYEIALSMAIEEAVQCIRKLTGSCDDAGVVKAKDALHNAIPRGSFSIPRVRFFVVPDLRPFCPLTPPKCSVMAAMTCLESRFADFTGSNVIDVARASAECIWENITGCNAVQQSIFKISVTQLFDSKLNLTIPKPSPLTEIISMLTIEITSALSRPKYGLWDICIATTRVSEKFEKVMMAAGEGKMKFERTLLRKALDVLERFNSFTCNDMDLVGETVTLPDSEPDTCKKSSIVRHYSYYLAQSIFTGFISSGDSLSLCQAMSSMNTESAMTAIQTCSAGFQKQMMFAHKHLLKASSTAVCQSAKVCNVKKASRCVSTLMMTVSRYGISKSQEDVCAKLRYTDKCVEENTYRCPLVGSFQTRYAMERRVAMQICGGLDEETFIPRCKVDSVKYRDTCDNMDAHRCISDFIDNVVMMPTLSRGRQCAEYTHARQCLQKKASGCVAQGTQMSYNQFVNRLDAFFGEEKCDMEDYEEDCEDGCQIQEAEECVSTLHMTVMENKGMMHNDICVAISEARACLTSRTWKCANRLRTQLSGKLDVVLRTANLHDLDCINIYGCMADFEGLAASIFNFQEDDDDDSPGMKRPIQARNEDLSLSSMCVLAEESWECMENGFHLLPLKKGKIIKMTLGNVHRAIKHRCANTVRQSCYVCDGAESNEDCNEKQEVCGDHYQACENVVKRGEDRVLRYYKSCVRPSFCGLGCEGEDCSSSCCVGDLCNEEYNAQTDMEPMTCRMDYALKCSLSLIHSVVDYQDIQCRSSQRDLECMEKYSRSCRSNSFSSLSSTAYQVLSSISRMSCSIKVTAAHCGSKAIQSTYSILSGGYTTLSNKACTAVDETTESIKRIEEQRICTLTELIPVRQSLSIIKQQTRAFCDRGDNSASCEAGTEGATELVEGRCSRSFLKTAMCLVDVITHFNSDGSSYCTTFRSGVSCLDHLKYCKVPASIESLKDLVSAMDTTNCGAAIPTTCQSDVCNLVDARACYANSVFKDVGTDDVCPTLRKTRGCVSGQMSACFSLQEVTVKEGFNAVVEERGAGCDIEELEMKDDIFTSLAVCLVQYTNDLETALVSADMLGGLCSAYKESKSCTSTVALPLLSYNFTKAALEDFNQGLGSFLEGRCDSETGGEDQVEERHKRDTGCAIGEAAKCMRIFNLNSWTISTTMIGDRSEYCKEMEASLKCKTDSMKECSDLQKQMMDAAMSRSNFDKYCDPLVYKDEGCDEDMIKKSKNAIEQLIMSAEVDNKEVCGNAYQAMKRIKKFSKTCTDAEEIMQNHRQYFGGILGNSCPKLTVGLFCGKDAPITRSCRQEDAQYCLENIDLSIDAEALPGFCSDLIANVTCARHNVDGCLKSEIESISNKMTLLEDDITVTTCDIEEALLDYEDVCTAKPTCSIRGARKCLQDLLDDTYSLSDCMLSERKKNCMLAHIQGCNYMQIPMVQALYSVLLPDAGDCTPKIFPLAVSPFAGELLSNDLKDEVMCMSDMFADLEDSLLEVTFNPRQSFCSLVKNYVTCRGADSFGVSPLNKFLADQCANSSMTLCATSQDICEDGSCIVGGKICDKTEDCSDGSDEAGCDVEESDACSPRKAAFCLMNQIGATVMAPHLSLSDKEDLCSQKESVQTCVTARTAACSDRIKNFFKDSLNISNTLLSGQEMCSEPEMCIIEQAAQCIDDLAVVVAKLDHAEDKTVMCKQYIETKNCKREFTATCAAGQLTAINAKFTEVEALIDNKCDEVEPEPEPEVLCPDIKEEDRKCEVFKAMECTLASYTTIFLYNPANSWENSKSCYALQSTIRCVASNISGCDPEKAQLVIDRLNEFRDRMKDRCLLVDTSLCGNPGPCPVTQAGCVKDFKTQLASPNGKGVCKLIQEAQDCISTNTINCSPQSWAQADFNLQKAIGEMKVKVRCDKVNIDECMLTFRHQAEEILISGVDDKSTICRDRNTTLTCLNDRMATAEIGDEFAPILENLVEKVKKEMTDVCDETSDPCSAEQSIHNILGIGVYLATTPTFNKQEFCSNVGLMLSKIDSDKLTACDGGTGLDGLRTDLVDRFTTLCQTTVGCQQLQTAATDCIGGLGRNPSCQEQFDAQFCVGKAIGQCPSIKTAVLTSYNSVFGGFTGCVAFPLLSFSLSNDNDIYMTEGGPSTDLVIVNEQQSMLQSSDTEIRIRVDLEAQSTVPICSDGTEITQLVTDKCGINFIGTGEIKSEFKFTAVADNRVDGYQTVTATVILEKFTLGTKTDLVLTRTLPPYSFVIQDRDVKSAICSSINDPHIRTFDGLRFNYMGTGTFLLYQSLGELNIEVQLEFQACGEGGSCNSGVFIRVDNDVIVFDRSDETQRFAPFVPEIKIQGDFTKAVKIMQSADKKVFQIVIATGQIIKVRNSDGLPNVWILASANDMDSTRGLCGKFDGDRYNDLTMPNNTKYSIQDGDTTYGSLTPNTYTNLWRVATEDQLHDGLQTEVDDTLFLETCSSCEVDESICSVFDATETCDLIRDGSTDVTSMMVAMSLQNTGMEVRKRRRRQAINPDVDAPQPGWPTPSGWLEANATEFCTRQVEDPQLTKLCEQAALMVNDTFESEQHIIDCIADIRLTDGTTYILATLNDLKQQCVDQISKDPNYIKDPELRKLVDEILDLYCSPADCNGHGRCEKGNCRCNADYLGSDCSISKEHLQPPVINGLRNNGLCRFSDTQSCTEIYVQGGNFVESELLTCHMEMVEIDSRGYRQVGGRQYLVSAELISDEIVTCKVDIEIMRKTAVLVTVSNDGNKHPNHEVFIAYDPTCHDCSPTSRRCYGPISGCDIEGRCYTTGAVAANDSCLECQPETNTHLWTQKSGLRCKLAELSGQTGSSSTDFKMLIALPVVCAVILFAAIAIIIALVLKRRSRRKRKTQGFENYPSMYQNPAYEVHDEQRQQTMTATDMEPQSSFRGRHIYPRANTTGRDMPGDNHC